MAERLWYPLWDSGVDIDHAVRSVSQSRQVAASDLPAVIGWLSVRAVAGTTSLGPKAWTGWCARLVDGLTERARTVLSG